MKFICNICGSNVDVALEEMERERGNCSVCGSTVRLRGLVHFLSIALFAKSMPVPQWPVHRDIFGVGVSDWYKFEEFLPPKISYQNTQFDREPLLNVARPSLAYRGLMDFVICSDVMEHVDPPVQKGFDGLFSMLKPGGAVIFTVPYGLEHTQEHFPDLHKWRLEKSGDQYTLHNVTVTGVKQSFTDLVFHGGWGQVLEMRVFGLKDLRPHYEAAGFIDFKVLEEDVPEFGIINKEKWSLPIYARRPATHSLGTFIFGLLVWPRKAYVRYMEHAARVKNHLARGKSATKP